MANKPQIQNNDPSLMGISADELQRSDSSSAELRKVLTHREELMAMLASPNLYIECAMIGGALALAWIIGMLIRRKTAKHLEKHPLKRIGNNFILNPLRLLAPLLAFFFLAFTKPLADEYAASAGLTEAMLHLCIAYMMAKAVVMVVRSRLVSYLVAFVIMTIAVLRVSGFLRNTITYLHSLGFDIGQFHISMLNIVNGVIILVVVFWGAGVLSSTLEGHLRRSSTLSYSVRELTVKFFRIFVYFIAFMITLSALGVDLTAFAVFGGALGVGIGLGLQKITANFVSGVTLLMEKSIQMGDLIEVGGSLGWVRQLNIRYALIETADGREVLIPNEELMSTRVTNWTHTTTLARIEILVGVSYESDATKARELMLEAARQHRLCLQDPPPNCWLRGFGELGYNFQLTFWIPDVKEGRNGPQSEVMFAIVEKFHANGIDIKVKQ